MKEGDVVKHKKNGCRGLVIDTWGYASALVLPFNSMKSLLFKQDQYDVQEGINAVQPVDIIRLDGGAECCVFAVYSNHVLLSSDDNHQTCDTDYSFYELIKMNAKIISNKENKGDENER